MTKETHTPDRLPERPWPEECRRCDRVDCRCESEAIDAALEEADEWAYREEMGEFDVD